ncbi:MAG: zinc-ribbon domain-containing protein [Anaerovoracaceae bacterium]
MEDKTLVCQDCGSEFVFTVGEQEFYKEKGFDNEPKRCKVCRDKKKQERRPFRGDRDFQ